MKKRRETASFFSLSKKAKSLVCVPGESAKGGGEPPFVIGITRAVRAAERRRRSEPGNRLFFFASRSAILKTKARDRNDL